MKSVKTILIFFFYVCCFNKYHFSESLCKNCCDCCDCCDYCEDEDKNIVKNSGIIKEEDEINFESISLVYNNLNVNLDNDELLAIKTYIYFKLSKDEQYSIM